MWSARRRPPATLFAALGDENRLRLAARLCDRGPLSIARLAEGSRITRQAISKHLRVMETSGLVCHARNGRETVWRLNPQRLDDARQYLETISRRWDEALLRLKHFVED